MKTISPFILKGFLFAGLLTGPDLASAAEPQKKQTAPQLGNSSSRANAERRRAAISERVRHELALLPYYGVFDWIEAQVMNDDSVVLRGQVTRPTTKSDAAYRIRKLESVSKVVNQIEELPPSPSDDRIRIAMYRAIFNYNGPLFRYSQGRPTIHIIVNNGRVALKGYVDDKMDKQLAYTYARGVPGVFEVRDELRVIKGG
jgi:hyperosmotically inducible protein